MPHLEPTYQAYLAWGALGIDVTVTRDIPGGVCGPFGTYPVHVGHSDTAPDLDALLRATHTALARAGYWPLTGWRPYRSGLLVTDLALVGASGAALADHLERGADVRPVMA